MNPFDFVNAINQGKKELMNEENNQLVERFYVPFLTNKSFSYFPDSIFHANELNRRPNLDNRLQFHYLINSIRPQRRYAKWVKKVDQDDLEVIKLYYGYNYERASEVLSLLSFDQITILRKRLEKGG